MNCFSDLTCSLQNEVTQANHELQNQYIRDNNILTNDLNITMKQCQDFDEGNRTLEKQFNDKLEESRALSEENENLKKTIESLKGLIKCSKS